MRRWRCRATRSSQHRVDGVVYDVALFTNLSQDHLDFHADMEDYFSAKAPALHPEHSTRARRVRRRRWGRRLAEESGVPVTTLTTLRGPEGGLGRRACDPDDPAQFTLRGNAIELDLRSALPGDFNVANTAMAAVALLLLGEDTDAVGRAILTDPHVPGRMERVAPSQPSDVESGLLAVVDYAHTPDAVEAALAALRPTTKGRLVVVLGAGGDRDRGKRHGMGRAAAGLADVVVVTDDNPRGEDPAVIRAAVIEGARSATPPPSLSRSAGAARRSARPCDWLARAVPGRSLPWSARGTRPARRSQARCSPSTTARSCARPSTPR